MRVDFEPFSTVCLDDGYALVSPNYGTCFVCDGVLYERILQRELDDELILKLQHLGMCVIEGYEGPLGCVGEPIVRPTFFLIDITQQCNLACIYCYRTLGHSSISPAALDRILEFIYAYCISIDCKAISIQPWGGEPLLAWDRICQIHEFFRARGISCKLSLETNGTCITHEVAHKLRAMNCGVGVSVDGTADIHDSNRPFIGGQGSFRWVIRGIDALRDAGYQADEIGTILTLTRNNLGSVSEIVDFLAGTLGLTGFRMNCVMRNGNMVNREMCITPEEFSQAQIQVLNKMIALYRIGHRFSESNILTKAHNLLYRAKGDICRAHGCQGGYRMIAFDPDGRIYPCNVTDRPELAIGHISDSEKLIAIIRTALDSHSFFRNSLADACAGCPWRYYCGGGCRTARFYDQGFLGGCDSFECRSNQVLYPYLLRLLTREPELIKLFGGW